MLDSIYSIDVRNWNSRNSKFQILNFRFQDFGDSKVKNIFKNTHHVSTIKSLDDNDKPDKYIIKKLSKYSYSRRKKIFAEDRPEIMEWVICKSKKQ